MFFKACLNLGITFLGILVLFSSPLKANDVESPESIEPSLPSLIESIRFKDRITYCGVDVPVERQDVKERLEKELLLALWDRPQVILWIKRSAKYFPHVEEILLRHGLPLDLKYAPVIESALRPHSKSSKGAVGYWQFLPHTGRQYGLRIDSQVDERKNIFKSTEAACRYLKRLHERFDSYLLALSGYNMGEYGLQNEIEAQKTTDFFSLYLPLETQRYIFKLISAKLILDNPSAYGFHIDSEDLYPLFEFDRVNLETDTQIPIVLVAHAARIPFKTVKDMNPELLGYYIGKGKISILLPKGKIKGFKERFAAQFKTWEETDKQRFHTVKKGENLTGIAKKYQISLSYLMKMNNLTRKRVIHPGDRLVVK